MIRRSPSMSRLKLLLAILLPRHSRSFPPRTGIRSTQRVRLAGRIYFDLYRSLAPICLDCRSHALAEISRPRAATEEQHLVRALCLYSGKGLAHFYAPVGQNVSFSYDCHVVLFMYGPTEFHACWVRDGTRLQILLAKNPAPIAPRPATSGPRSPFCRPLRSPNVR